MKRGSMFYTGSAGGFFQILSFSIWIIVNNIYGTVELSSCKSQLGKQSPEKIYAYVYNLRIHILIADRKKKSINFLPK